MLRLAYEGMTKNIFYASNATLQYNTIQNKQLIKLFLDAFPSISTYENL